MVKKSIKNYKKCTIRSQCNYEQKINKLRFFQIHIELLITNHKSQKEKKCDLKMKKTEQINEKLISYKNYALDITSDEIFTDLYPCRLEILLQRTEKKKEN